MAEKQQTLANHARFHPPFHFFVIPVLLLHVIWTTVRLVHYPGWNTAEATLVAVALFVMSFLVRVNPLRVQDRLIRLEEQLRFRQNLPQPLATRAITELTPAQIVSLRFASDAELTELVEKVLAGGVTKPGDIKKAIREWRGDYFRV